MNFNLFKSSFLSMRVLRSNILTKSLTTSHTNCLAAPPAKHPSADPKRTVNDNENTPIEFLGSKAASWNARDSRSGGAGGSAEEMLWYQPYVISASVAVFLIYFCILREENDIDRKLEGSLFEHISGLEEAQLIMSYKYNRENNLDVKAIENRLNELGIDAKALN